MQRLSSLFLNRDQAEIPGASAGDSVLLVERVGFNMSGVAIEFSQPFYRGDSYKLVAELSIPE